MQTLISNINRISLILLLSAAGANAQSRISLDECYTRAKENYPLIKQVALLSRSKDYSLDNASRGYLPQASIGGQATYQSAVTELPIPLPTVTIPSISKDQYKLYGEIVQPLTDVITINHQKELITAATAVEEQKLEVEFYKLKERINSIYFGILLLDAQIGQADLLRKDLQTGINKTNAAIANGIALKINADLLNAELLKSDQKIIELKAARKAYLAVLAVFTNQTFNEGAILETPYRLTITNEVKRPELNLYESQKKVFDAQRKLINSKNIPKFNFFFQGGFGRPALNFLSNNFDPYYITGLRLNWNLTGLYTAQKEKKLLGLNQSALDIQKETFLFNTNLSLRQQNTELEKFEELIQTDKKIVALRDKVKITANKQLELETITTNDYLLYVNAADQAKQNLLLHEIQFLLALYNYQTISGN